MIESIVSHCALAHAQCAYAVVEMRRQRRHEAALAAAGRAMEQVSASVRYTSRCIPEQKGEW